MTTFRLMKRRPASEAVALYFNHVWETVGQLKGELRKLGWAWDEFRNLEEVKAYTNATCHVSLSSADILQIEKELSQDVLFYIANKGSYWSEALPSPTFFDLVRWADESLVCNKDPDHQFIEGIEFERKMQTNADGEDEFLYVEVTFWFGS